MITLNGETFAAVRDLDGNHVVIRQCGRMWRLADPHMTVRVLARLSLSPLRIV